MVFIKHLNKYLLFMVISFTLAACGHAGEQADTSNAVPSSALPDQSLIHLVKAQDVVISAAKHTDSNLFKGLVVQAGQLSKEFDWANVTNPTYYPAVHIADINGDGVNEIVIILTTKYGTGIKEQEIHVLNKDELSELALENPLQVLQERVASEISHEQGQVKVSVEAAGSKVERTYSEEDAVVWNEEVAFGSIIRYSVSDGIITAAVPGSVSPASFAVNALLEYGPDLKVRSIRLEPAL
ncbi:hypothetical protein [Paenibacillus ihumii]|uniref:hypothetical protein n=1 Tax=Paenibacillus ihumii TaxID=687436 RepID=UPI000AFA951F|nr:hypothetical protein [Paenibacillus ihumii]